MAACRLAELLCWAFRLLGAKAGLLGPWAIAGFAPVVAEAGSCWLCGWFSLAGLPALSSSISLCKRYSAAPMLSLQELLLEVYLGSGQGHSNAEPNAMLTQKLTSACLENVFGHACRRVQLSTVF